MANALEISPLRDEELGRLFGLAKCCFEESAGWEVAGYVALRQRRKHVVVEHLLVAPGHEQRGIGHRLLEHAEGYAIATHARAVDIVVEADNWRARSFYSRLGYVAVAPELFQLTLPTSL
jgi:ribosomal protein S18 acetylase RimI-like enzyme